MSTTSRLLLGFLLCVALGLYYLEDKLVRRVEREYLEAAEESMVDVAQIFAALIEDRIDESGNLDVVQIRNVWAAAKKRPISALIYDLEKTTLDMDAYVVDRRGLVLFDSDDGREEGTNLGTMRDVWLTLAGEYGARSTLSDPDDDDSSVMFVGAAIRHDGAIIGAVSVAKPQRALFPFRDQTKRRMYGMGLIFFGIVTCGAYLVVTLFSRPIRRLTEYARAVARGERATPPVGGSPEAATLARAFEEMRNALENRQYVESYVQTLTHEMKSPVAAIRGAAELLREDLPSERRERFLGNIEAEAQRLQNIIDRLLVLSALEARQTLEHPEPVALTKLAENVRDQLAPTAEARGVRLEVESNAAPPTIIGEPFLLEIALSNLVQNALDFASSDTRVRIFVDVADDDRTMGEIVVKDEGPGIPDYALPRIFDRFYSLQHPATGRKSSGLGLCFVREVAGLHRGSITVSNRTDGSGVRATLRFPAGDRVKSADSEAG